ncbi:hypothetical protein DSOL_3519 [Desulfosporosinus metallidurans]|uniref:Uncharacterized protein n=1 Tax=Desulfosporosinus metallidurans TaxID=1888891 RepID=A0A1Q8QQC0_9FIRM|nr:hypothetical protein DSOL_3519 [Desulfosporosinus metallidurans]
MAVAVSMMLKTSALASAPCGVSEKRKFFLATATARMAFSCY